MLIHLLDSLDTERQISRQKKITLYSQKRYNYITYFNVILVCLCKYCLRHRNEFLYRIMPF